MCPFLIPLCDGRQVLHFLLARKVYLLCAQVPAETEVRYFFAERDRFGVLPFDAKLYGEAIDVHVCVGEFAVGWRAGGSVG